MRVIDECTRVESSELIVHTVNREPENIVNWCFEIILSTSPDVGNSQQTGAVRVLQTLLAKR